MTYELLPYISVILKFIITVLLSCCCFALFCLLVCCLFVYLFISFLLLFIRLFRYSLIEVNSFIHSFVLSSVCSFNHSFVRSIVRYVVRSFIHVRLFGWLVEDFLFYVFYIILLAILIDVCVCNQYYAVVYTLM